MKTTPFKKEFIYYFGAFALTGVVVLLYGFVRVIRDDLGLQEGIGDLWVLPFLVLGLLVVYETMLGLLIKRQAPRRNEKQFNMHVSTTARHVLDLQPADFQTLRQNQKFQTALHDCYRLFTQNPRDFSALDHIKTRFSGDPFTQDVVTVIIEETKVLIQEQTPKQEG